MTAELKVCGLDIKGFTKLIATTGIALSLFSLLTIFYIPLRSYLMTALIAFSTSITINFVLVIASLILVFKMDDFDLRLNDYNTEPIIYISKDHLKIIIFCWIFIILLLTVFTNFSIIVTYKLRNLLIFEYLDANLPPEELRPRLNLNFGNIYSSDSDDLRQTNYSNPTHMSANEYINLNQR